MVRSSRKLQIVRDPSEDSWNSGGRQPTTDAKPLPTSAQRIFGAYELLASLGRGGMATLYVARLRGRQFEKLVAIKKIHEHLSDEVSFVQMFQDEARIAALIQHPNVAALYDSGKEAGSHFIAMEYVHGETLSEVLRHAQSRGDKLDWPLVARIIADAANGLHAAHTLADTSGMPVNVVHRDVSPHNVLISFDGVVKVIDFGVALAAQKLAQTKVGVLKGKLGYMSPEQVGNQPLDARSDVFALGVLLYEAATVRRLFSDGNEASTLLKVRAARVPDPLHQNPDLPEELVRIMKKALARSRQDRYQSALELADDLNELLHAEGQVVTQKHLAGLMSERFSDTRQIRDQQIRMALEGSDLLSMAAADNELESSFPITRPEPPRPRRWVAYTLAGVAFAGVLLVLGWLLLKPTSTARSPTPAITANAPVAQPAATHVTFTITVRVPRKGVSIRFRDRWYPGHTARFAISRSKLPERVLIRATGHRDEELSLVPSVDRAVVLSLQPAAARSIQGKARPIAHPKPLASAGPNQVKRRSRMRVARARSKSRRRRIRRSDADTVDPFK